jgi:hypothetical protein
MAAMTLGVTGCAGFIEWVAPTVFYGYVEQVEADGVCLTDPRPADPRRERCFAAEPQAVPPDLERGTLVRVEYEAVGDEEVVTGLEIVRRPPA